MPIRTCEWCRIEFKRKIRKRDAARFCTRKCSGAKRTAVSRARLALIRRARTCLCGKALVGRTRYCSIACRPSSYRLRQLRTFICETCKVGISVHMGGRKRWCSRDCWKKSAEGRATKRATRARRKARERGNKHEHVDPYVVFARDGWRCRACGVKTPAKLRGHMVDNAPELDHIVPLGGGFEGEHTHANTQCLCRKCNLSKGAKVLGQLRLAV